MCAATVIPALFPCFVVLSLLLKLGAAAPLQRLCGPFMGPLFHLRGICAGPLLAGLIPEYLVCRFTRRRWWKVLPPLAVAAITALVTAGRLSVWESDVSPVTQLLFVPGVPAAFALLGTLLGWRLWKRLWSPRVVKDRRGG